MPAPVEYKHVGLTSQQVQENIKKYGLNFVESEKLSTPKILLRQFKGNYLIHILIAAAIISFFLKESASSIYILFMVVVSMGLGFWNEYSAQKTVNLLLKRISPKTLVRRDGREEEIFVDQITVGDIVLFATGSVIPADMVILEAENLEINENVLTGESLAIHKKVNDSIFMGTNIESGHGLGIVNKIGASTKYGQIARTLSFNKPETAFQKGLRGFGNVIIKLVFILTAVVFTVNFALGRDWLTSLMFSLAIAVGLTPELLPVVISMCLSRGAGKLSKKNVIVKQLVAVENLGNMDILCCDKTGTLTEGKIQLVDYFNASGEKKPKVLQQAFLSLPKMAHSKHFQNAINKAILSGIHALGIPKSMGAVKYIDHEPFDYNKKASFNIVEFAGDLHLVVKGDFHEVFKMCGQNFDSHALSKKIMEFSSKGNRTVAVASKVLENTESEYSWAEATNLTFDGILVLSDPPRKDAKSYLEKLAGLNVDLKVLTGDNETVALKICQEVGLSVKGIVLGSQMEGLTKTQLENKILNNNLFAKITPEQKLDIIKVLQEKGHTVGFLGDGVNDAPALYTADVGISVNDACDVAKQASSVVLMQKGLNVIVDGIIEGRRTFNNTIKYILMGASSNFGNMFSAASSSFILPFLPMTPVQILLNNTFYDFSQLTIPTDSVDKESLIKPKKWDVTFIKKYMMFFGPISSIFDFITFFGLLWVFKASSSQFQAGWFLESLITQVLIIFVIRTSKFPFFKSKPSKLLILSTTVVLFASLGLVFLPIRDLFGFGVLPVKFLGFLFIVTTLYIIVVDLLKTFFIKEFKVWN